MVAWLDEVMPLNGFDDEGRVVTRGEALRQVGPAAIRYRCRSGCWLRLAPSVYLTKPPATPRDRLRAAALHGGPGSVVSGAAALIGLGFRTVRRAWQELVLVAADSGVQSWGRIRVRRTLRLPVARYRDRVPLAPVPRAVADHVVQLRSPGQVQAVVAESIQRRLCTVADLVAELEAGPRRGSKLFRDALRDVGYGAHSVPEAKAGRLLRRADIGGFEQNAEIYVRGRRFVADFLWRELRAVLEIDSTEHHLSPEDHAATLARDQLLQAGGYVVLHVKPSQLASPAAFVELIREWLDALARRSTPRLGVS
jgi:very-short-patch-repair endonuclease